MTKDKELRIKLYTGTMSEETEDYTMQITIPNRDMLVGMIKMLVNQNKSFEVNFEEMTLTIQGDIKYQY